MNSTEHEVNCLPKWNPQPSTRRLFESDFQIRKKALRNSSSNYIRRPDVRKALFSIKGTKCYICKENDADQIDHIVSVYRYAKEKLHIGTLNTIDNLAPICAKCNASKKP